LGNRNLLFLKKKFNKFISVLVNDTKTLNWNIDDVSNIDSIAENDEI